MKKVLLINTSFDKGGTVAIANYFFYLNSNDWYGIKIYFYGRRANELELKHSFKFSYQVELIYMLLEFEQLEWKAMVVGCLQKGLKGLYSRKKFNLIHLQNIHGYI